MFCDRALSAREPPRSPRVPRATPYRRGARQTAITRRRALRTNGPRPFSRSKQKNVLRQRRDRSFIVDDDDHHRHFDVLVAVRSAFRLNAILRNEKNESP